MENSGITIIITVWKRAYLDFQLKSLVNQSVQPDYILILQNGCHIDIKSVVEQYRNTFPNIYIIHSELNLKYFGRFSICNNVETKYVFVIDDDVIPSTNWLHICLEKCNKYNSIISCTGRIIPPGDFRPEEGKGVDVKKHFIGDCYNSDNKNFSPNDKQVDYGCNSYFLKTEWIRCFWSIWPITFQSGEDIHLSATLMLLKAIPTIVPQQTSEETCGNLKKLYSADLFSSWRNSDFIDIRETIFEFFINEKKWKPLLWNYTP